MRKLLFSLAFAGLGAFLGASARADTFAGSSFAHFHDPSGAVNQNNTTISNNGPGETNNLVTSGAGVKDATNPLGLPNSIEMDSSIFGGVSVGDHFGVSLLRYHNGETTLGTSDTVFPVHLDINFTSPTGFTQTFSFTFDLTITPNNASPITDPANADTLAVAAAFAPETFTIGSNIYTLELLGFQDPANSMAPTTTTFTLPEDTDVSANLIAEITAPPTAAPLPSTAWAGLALLGVVGANMARRRYFAQA